MGPTDEYAAARRAMLERIEALFAETAAATGIPRLDTRVRAALGRVPRHRFVPEDRAAVAYADTSIPIGHGQTISQPYIVALMTQLAEVGPETHALDVGAGSGYQTAVLAELARRVHAIEIVPELARDASARLAALGYENVELRCGDGFAGWEEAAPFDAILVAAAIPEVPPPLVEQLAPGGRLVLPLGRSGGAQELALLRKDDAGLLTTERVLPVAFVPFTRSE